MYIMQYNIYASLHIRPRIVFMRAIHTYIYWMISMKNNCMNPPFVSWIEYWAVTLRGWQMRIRSLNVVLLLLRCRARSLLDFIWPLHICVPCLHSWRRLLFAFQHTNYTLFNNHNDIYFNVIWFYWKRMFNSAAQIWCLFRDWWECKCVRSLQYYYLEMKSVH